jgi:O-antigen ligase
MYADKKQLFTIVAKASDTPTDGPSWMMLSNSSHATLVVGLKVAAYCGMFFLVLNTVTSKQRMDILVYTIILIGLFQSVYAIVQTVSIAPKVWWWKSRVGRLQWASGTFIVSNHFAAYMNMVLFLAFGFLIAQRKRTQRLMSGLGGLRSFSQKVVGWVAPESTRPKMIFFFFTALLIGLAVLLSASRGGILSLGVTMLFMAGLFLFKKRYSIYTGLALLLCMATLAYGVHVGIDPTIEKFENPHNRDGRFHVLRTIIPMIGDYPVLGVGLGNFRYVYPRYIDDYDRVRSSGYAHNDWIENGTETGLLGLSLILLGFGTYIVRLMRIWYRRRDFHALGIGAGIVAGLLSIGMHSFVDFNMHIPANPLTLAALLAVGYAAVCRTGHGYSESFFYRKREITLTRFRRFAILGLVLLACGSAVCWAGKHFIAESLCPSESNSTMNLNWDPTLSHIELATMLNSHNFRYHYKRGYYFATLDAETEEEKAFHLETKNSLEQALRRNPANSKLWYDLGEIYSTHSYDMFDYFDKWLPLAEKCFEEGVKCAPKNENILFNVAWYWVWRARVLPEQMFTEGPQVQSDKDKESEILFREDAIHKFQKYFQRSLALNPQRWKEAAQRTWEYFPEDTIVLGIVPENNAVLKSDLLKFLVKL